MIKVSLGVFLGGVLYLFLSYYQPIAESTHVSSQAEAANAQSEYPFVSSIPFELLVVNSNRL